MIPQHQGGRLHVGRLFQEASDRCTDECGTGKVCFLHMTDRLKEVADEVQTLELQIEELKKKVDAEKLAHSKSVCTAMQTMGDLNATLRLNGELRQMLVTLKDRLDGLNCDHIADDVIQDAEELLKRVPTTENLSEIYRGALEKIKRNAGEWEYSDALSFIDDVLYGTEKRDDDYPTCKCGAVLPAPGITCAKCGRIEKRDGEVCDSCGWNNGPNHGGGIRVMYTMGKVTKCGSCLPTTR